MVRIAFVGYIRNSNLSRCRILVIEDDREMAEQLVDSLATSGYEVDLAVDGDDGGA